jgi:hypothetical protein
VKPRAMLVLLALLALPCAAGTALGQGIGAYFTLVNTYVDVKAPHDGRRVLVRPRQAFTVVDVATDAQDQLWYLVVLPDETVKVSGIGWTAAAPHELVAASQEPVTVLSRIPTEDVRGLQSAKVPAGGVELLNETQSSAAFAQVDWQKVRYQFETPLRAWARGGAGIYRPGKTAAFLSRVYGELLTRNVDKDEQTRLLSGVIRIGDPLREVRWALGDPLRSQDETVGEARRSTWQYPELTVTFENGVIKQIN